MNHDDILGLLQARSSVRRFHPQPVPREVLERLLRAAVSAPSASNRQPWRFTVVARPETCALLAEVARRKTEALRDALAKGPHGAELASYLDYFHRPLETAPAVIAVEWRTYPDLIARALESSGAEAQSLWPASEAPVELSGVAAATMALLVQAQAEGLGACWMAGPLAARSELEAMLEIASPWRLFALVPLGYPDEAPAKPPRKPLPHVVRWLGE